MVDSVFASFDHVGLLVLRTGLAAVFFAHGWQKVQNISGVTGFFNQLGIPLAPLAARFVATLETLGAALLFIGLGTRIVALLLVGNMLMAIVKFRFGMVSSPFVGGEKSGWELEFALMVGALVLVFTGAGAYSLDAALGL